MELLGRDRAARILCLRDRVGVDRFLTVLARDRAPAFFDLLGVFFLGYRLGADFATVSSLIALRKGRSLAAAFPAKAPTTPPTTAPTGPATLPTAAPATAPAVCFGIGGT